MVRIYLDHHERLDQIPRLLDEAVQNVQLSFRDRLANAKDAESANREVVKRLRSQLRRIPFGYEAR